MTSKHTAQAHGFREIGILVERIVGLHDPMHGFAVRRVHAACRMRHINPPASPAQ